jgi:hypothetical protein
MFSNGPLDFFYAAHHQMASSVLNMTFSLTDPFTVQPAGSLAFRKSTEKKHLAFSCMGVIVRTVQVGASGGLFGA